MSADGMAEVARITCIVHRAAVPAALAAAKDARVEFAYSMAGKEVSILERRGPFGLGYRASPVEEPIEQLRFYVDPSSEADVAARLYAACAFDQPGRGAIFASRQKARGSLPVAALHEHGAARPSREARAHSLACCILPRGEAGRTCLSILEAGLAVPTLHYGEGVGLRSRLGLLRVVVPAEKELAYFLVPDANRDALAQVVSRVAGLDEPGRGIAYSSEVRCWAANSRVRHGIGGHAASIEQIVQALDDIRGGAEWRRKSAADAVRAEGRRPVRASLACLTITCEEGRAKALAGAAMEAGAGGATLSRISLRETTAAARANASHALETCDLILARDAVPGALDALEAAGLYGGDSGGFVELGEVERIS
jgi:hypothetical protein